MTDLDSLEARVTALEDVESIKMVKAKYWRCIDRKLWDELGECFSEDAITDYGPGKQLKGNNLVVEFFRNKSNARIPTAIQIHHGHNPEIRLISSHEASGIWQIFNYRIDTESNMGTRIGGFYTDTYLKEKGEWKISSSVMNYLFWEDFDREKQGLNWIPS